jgi:hypothetical protein
VEVRSRHAIRLNVCGYVEAQIV